METGKGKGDGRNKEAEDGNAKKRPTSLYWIVSFSIIVLLVILLVYS